MLLNPTAFGSGSLTSPRHSRWRGRGSGDSLTRRGFLAGAVAAAAATPLAADALAGPEARQRWRIIGFSKPFKDAAPAQTAEIVAEIGWDGIECPVRAGGQIEPVRVEEDLPKLVDALRQVGREVTVITTDVKRLDPLAEKVLRTARRLGIGRYRLAFWDYAPGRAIPEQVAEVRAATRDLAAFNKELGLCGGHQNHSGANRFGASVWDIHEVLGDLDPRYMGIFFDIGHARIEGGLSWPTEARLMRPYFASVFVKDFLWQKGRNGWQPRWCPLGEGMVPPEFFKWLSDTSYQGPICQHHEYPVGHGPTMVEAMKKDLARLKQWLNA